MAKKRSQKRQPVHNATVAIVHWNEHSVRMTLTYPMPFPGDLRLTTASISPTGAQVLIFTKEKV